MKIIPNHNLITLKRTLRHILGGESTAIDKCTTHYFRIAALWINSEGIDNAVKRLKVVYTSSVQFTMNHHNSFRSPEKVWVAQTGGLPRKFRFLWRYLRSSDHRKVRFGLTILRTYVLFNTKINSDISSITDPFKGSGVYCRDSVYKVASMLMTRNKIEVYQPQNSKHQPSWYISSSGGPNVSPAYLSWVEDGFAVRAERSLWCSIYKLASLQRNMYVTKVLGKPGSFWSTVQWLRKRLERWKSMKVEVTSAYVSGKIQFLPEGGGKTRVIAIGDIYSQSVLKPIHDHLMKALRSLGDVDGTFDQSGIVQRLKDASSLYERVFYSFDLSNCTDRFPVSFQEECLIPLLGSEVAGLWRSILTDRLFYNPKTGEEVKYSVGQPMGLLSSWAAMAWSHHCVIQYCALRCGERNFRSYAILGDDLVIWNDCVAREYREFMTLHLGVGISLSKSIVSYQALEFAKVLVKKGVVYSPFPLKLMQSVSDFPTLLPMLWKDNYRWFDEIVDPLELLQLVPKNKWWRAAQLITCPLYSQGSSVWPVSESSLWAWLKVERVLGNEDPQTVVKDSMEKFDLLSYMRHFGNCITPLEKYLSDIVHPLALGVPSNFGMVPGDNFIMSTPFSEFAEPGMTHEVLFKRYGNSSKRIEKYLEISRLLARAAIHFKAVVPEEVMYYELKAGNLRPNVGQ